MKTLISFCKDRSKLNLSIDIILLLLLMPMAGLGFLIKYVLISGIQRNALYGSNVDLEFLGMDRYQWGTIHLILSISFLALMALHIVLHWKMVVCIFRKIFPGNTVRIITAVILCLSSLLLVSFPLYVTPSQVPHEPEYRNRNTTGREQQFFQEKAGENLPAATEGISNGIKTGEAIIHKHPSGYEEYEVSGSQTLQSVADKYHVPAEKICSDLNIPGHLAGVRLGRLKKQYPFTMDDIKESISEYKQKTK